MRRPALLAALLSVSIPMSLACGGARVGATSPATRATGAPPATGATSPKPLWSDFDQNVFARAKKEGRYVVLDGAAEWCHFCHVMEAQTYGDPRVRAVLEKHFIATKVDIDVRPDIEERYGDYGWPATVIFSPDGEELGKYRGYIPPDQFLEILGVVASGAAKKPAVASARGPVPKTPLSDDALELVTRFAESELEEYWDSKEGGWGREPKVPIGWNSLWALSRGKAGDATLKAHALTVLDKQRKIIDPVWGGIYQYSVAPDWDHPHFEKLMFWNAGALASYAEAFALTQEPKWKALAGDIRRYFEAFMLSEGGAFYGTQDADLNSHAPSVPYATTSPRGKGDYVKGEDYYKLGDKERRALGVPRIDPNEYADDNGLAIFAYATYARATADAGALDIARKAAARILARLKTPSGGVLHVVPTPTKPGDPIPKSAGRVHLSDVAAFGFGLVHLADVSREAKWRDEAASLASFLEKELYDVEGGAFFSQPPDPDAVGVFRVRRKPFEENILALRFLVALDRLEGSPKRRAIIEHSLRALSTPAAIKDRFKFLGDYLSLVDEVGAHRKLTSAPAPAKATPATTKPTKTPQLL